MDSRRLVLGTVQFGLPYGVANAAGQISLEETAAIVDFAWSAGLNMLDTAIVYGESEKRLGEIGVGKWQVISKLPAIPERCEDIEGWVRESVIGSLGRLKISRLHGLLLHCPQDLQGPHGAVLYKGLLSVKLRGLVRKIGISLYSPSELDAIENRFELDIVQAPFNILDRRLAASGWLSRLHRAGTEVHVRSVFLQGLLLMGAPDRPAYFNRWSQLWREWHNWLDSQGLVPAQACLGFAGSHPEIDRMVVGVDSLKHLKEIVAGNGVSTVMPPAALRSDDPDLINPSLWKLH